LFAIAIQSIFVVINYKIAHYKIAHYKIVCDRADVKLAASMLLSLQGLSLKKGPATHRWIGLIIRLHYFPMQMEKTIFVLTESTLRFDMGLPR